MFNYQQYKTPASAIRAKLGIKSCPSHLDPVSFMCGHYYGQLAFGLAQLENKRKLADFTCSQTEAESLEEVLFKVGTSLLAYGVLEEWQLKIIVECSPTLNGTVTKKKGLYPSIPLKVLPLPLSLRLIDNRQKETDIAWMTQGEQFLEWCLNHIPFLEWREDYGRFILNNEETQHQLVPYQHLWETEPAENYVLLYPLPILGGRLPTRRYSKTIHLIKLSHSGAEWIPIDTDTLEPEICSEIAHRLGHHGIRIVPQQRFPLRLYMIALRKQLYRQEEIQMLVEPEYRDEFVLVKVKDAPPNFQYVIYDKVEDSWLFIPEIHSKMLALDIPVVDTFPFPL